MGGGVNDWIKPEQVEGLIRSLNAFSVSVSDAMKAILPVAEEINRQFMKWAVDFFGVSARPDFQVRFRGEHPLDWIERVGAGVSGYNIRPGERWRFETLRDGWAPDDVLDEYGVYCPVQKDAWS